MEWSEDILRKMVSMGTLGYSTQKIINILDIENEDALRADLQNPESKLFKAYQKGMDKADYAVDMKLYELAKNGDLKALEKWEERKQDEQHRETTDKKLRR